MKHDYNVNGFSYRLRPVTLDDAQFIIDNRLEDEKKSKFVHRISSDITLQINWLKNYFERENDYYFVVENIFTGEAEGLTSLYNIANNKGEWGRWVFKRGSLGAVESAYLIYKFAFDVLRLSEVYTHTIVENEQVVNFHKSINANFRMILKNNCEVDGISYDEVEQFVGKDRYVLNVFPKLERVIIKLFERNIKLRFSSFKFNHYIFDNSDYLSSFDKFKENLNNLLSKIVPDTSYCSYLQYQDLYEKYLGINKFLAHSSYNVNKVDGFYSFFTQKYDAKEIFNEKNSFNINSKHVLLLLNNGFLIELVENI